MMISIDNEELPSIIKSLRLQLAQLNERAKDKENELEAVKQQVAILSNVKVVASTQPQVVIQERKEVEDNKSSYIVELESMINNVIIEQQRLQRLADEKNASLEAKLTRMEREYKTKSDDAASQLKLFEEKLLRVMEEQQSQQVLVTNLSISIVGNVESQTANFNNASSIIKKVQEKHDQTTVLISELSTKLRNVVDTSSLSDGRLKELEKNFSKLSAKADSPQDHIPHAVIAQLNHHITRIESEKASRKELNAKADLNSVLNKVDVTEVSRLDEKIGEQVRRVTQQNKEIDEKMNLMQKNADKKVDFMAQWCLKQMRKELRGEVREGTDIGRIKCLVCDQVVIQRVENETAVFGGPGMKSTMKTLRVDKKSNSQPDTEDVVLQRPSSAKKGVSDDIVLRPSSAKQHTTKLAALGGLLSTTDLPASSPFPEPSSPPPPSSSIPTTIVRMQQLPNQQTIPPISDRPVSPLHAAVTVPSTLSGSFQMQPTSHAYPQQQQHANGSLASMLPYDSGDREYIYMKSALYMQKQNPNPNPKEYFKDLERSVNEN